MENNSYQALIVRWLTGANSGVCGPMYITSRGRGTSLFISGVKLYDSHNPNKKRRRIPDIRLAILQDGEVHILTSHDTLGIASIAERLGLTIVSYDWNAFKADGTIKNGIIQVR